MEDFYFKLSSISTSFTNLYLQWQTMVLLYFEDFASKEHPVHQQRFLDQRWEARQTRPYVMGEGEKEGGGKWLSALVGIRSSLSCSGSTHRERKVGGDTHILFGLLLFLSLSPKEGEERGEEHRTVCVCTQKHFHFFFLSSSSSTISACAVSEERGSFLSAFSSSSFSFVDPMQIDRREREPFFWLLGITGEEEMHCSLLSCQNGQKNSFSHSISSVFLW